jgi:diguanylate cyclase (GGDEF)-like protein
MQASSATRRPRTRVDFRAWAWWQLPWVLRIYIGVTPVICLALAVAAATRTSWHTNDLMKFGLLLGCGVVSVIATPRVAHFKGGIVRDFITVWVLPIAILLPPVYAMVAPAPLLWLTQRTVHRGVVYRRVFTAGAIGLAYGLASLLFHRFPSSVAGGSLGTGRHVLTWTLVVCVCELAGWLMHDALIITAIKLTDPTATLRALALNHDSLQGDFAQVDLGVLVTVGVGANPLLAVFGVPTVLLARRFMMHEHLLAKSRMDAKTGLLNSSTWETEAEAEIARAVRTRSPVTVALIDIDHFKAVNDTYGHLVGDIALKAVAAALRAHLRGYDLAGRFGGEEFVVLLPQTTEADALAIAERLRMNIAMMGIPIGDDAGTCVRLTVSVGIAALDGTARELTDLLAAADSALYYAKDNGRNKTHAMAAVGLR